MNSEGSDGDDVAHQGGLAEPGVALDPHHTRVTVGGRRDAL